MAQGSSWMMGNYRFLNRETVVQEKKVLMLLEKLLSSAIEGGKPEFCVIQMEMCI